MRRLTLFLLLTLLCGITLAQAVELKPRLVFEKYLFADGVNPQARDLRQLTVKFFDEDLVRLRDGELRSLNGADLSMTSAFLAAHPEITLKPYILSETEADYQARTARIEAKSGQDLVDLFSFQIFSLTEPAGDPRALLAELLLAPEIEIAYYQGIPVDATCTDIGWTTPDYVAGQTYHDPAPLGTDLDYAQLIFGADVVDGENIYNWTGIFERGLQTTHEDVELADVGTTGTPDADNNHGTAVMGILGACDDNGVGMLGYLADMRMRLYQRNSGDYASTADVYDLANSQLIAGEVTNSSWGYFSDPMPAGQTCPDNPGQNGTVPCEYDPGVKAAIQAGVAAGIHYFICAHNGCTDLDDVIFGDTFDWSTDTGSIIVGACESAVSGNGHDAISWTSYGSRLTSFSWGENIYSTGYGTLWSGGGSRDEWYYDDFGGTSGATPIVAGCGGVLNNIWRYQNAGDNIDPATMRDWLQTHGTPNTAPATEIGVMPDLFGILAPDVAPFTLYLWDADLVVNNTLGDHTIPANLSPLPADTYIAWGWVNWSRFSAADPARSICYRDDVALFSSAPTLNPYSATYINGVGHQFRGGNHYMKQINDPNAELDESDETNNTSVHMYVWDGIDLERDIAQTYTRAPLKNPEGVFYYAKDGFANGGNLGGYWEAFGVMPEAAGNYNLFSHSVAPNATDGFTTYESYSSYTSYVDFVGTNKNEVPYPVWVSVINYDDNDDDYTIEGDAADGVNFFGSLPATQTLELSEAINAGEILDIFEMNLVAGEDVWVNIANTGGNADLVVLVYGPAHTYFARMDYDWIFNSGGPGESESGIFTPTASGYHGVVVCKNLRSELNESASYDFYWGPPQGDLTHFVRAGWDYELVPRNQGVGSTGVLPALLNEGASVADNAYINIGAGIYELGSNSAFYLDGPQTYVSGNFVVNIAPGAEAFLANRTLGVVKGGRHEVGAIIDVNAEVVEELPLGESNNDHYMQFCWAPFGLANQTPLVRAPAPNYLNANNPEAYAQPNSNQDGYYFNPLLWTGVAVMPHSIGDSYNLGGYDYHSTDPLAAYLNGVSIAFPAPGSIGFVMMNGNQISGNRDFGIRNNFQWPTTPSIDDYTVEGCQRIEDLSGSYPEGPFTIAAGSIIHTYDIHLSGGTEYPVLLGNESGADLGIAIFDEADSYAGMTDALVYLDSFGAGSDESGSVTPITSGWHGVAVFKHGTSDLPLDAVYRLRIGIVYPPAAITDLTVTPYDFTPGNAIVEINFTPIDEDVWGWPLAVDHYTIWAVQDDPYDFSSAYVEDLGTSYNDGNGLLYFHNLGWLNRAFFYLVAVDIDGFLLTPPTDCPWEKLSDIPGYSTARQLLTVPADATVPAGR